MTAPTATAPLGRVRTTKHEPLVAARLCLPSDPEQPGRQIIVDHVFTPGLVTLITPYAAAAKALLRTLALRAPPASGSLHLGQLDLLGLDPAEAGLWRRETLRVVSPEMNIPPSHRVLQYIQVATAEHEPMAAVPRAVDLLDRFDLGRRVGTKVGQLAAGSAEAVGIAAALCVLPRILLIDDVTRHMGAQLAGRVMLAVRHQARKRGMIVIAASTDRVVEDFADARLPIET